MRWVGDDNVELVFRRVVIDAGRVYGCADIGRRPQDAEQGQGHDDDQWGQAVFDRTPCEYPWACGCGARELPVKGRRR